MLGQSQRTAILELHRQGVPSRAIARLMDISRVTVRRVLESNSGRAGTESSGEGRALPAADPGVDPHLEGESGAGP